MSLVVELSSVVDVVGWEPLPLAFGIVGMLMVYALRQVYSYFCLLLLYLGGLVL